MQKKMTEKPKYRMGQNVWFMIKTAWEAKEKKALFLSLLTALTAVALNLFSLYVSPSILSAVERHASVTELILTIAVFVGGMMLFSGVQAYLKDNVQFGRISVRMALLKKYRIKLMTTSYANWYDERFETLKAKAFTCFQNNDRAAEAIWDTLTVLTTNILGFIIYTGLLSSVQPFLIGIILLTAVVSYFMNIRLSEYGYRHREEEAAYVRQLMYLSDSMKDEKFAKDIRIFGLRPWIEELYQKALGSYVAFNRKAQGIYIWGKIADLVFAFLRNGIAYAYLITLVLQGELTTAEFLLYFGVVSGFSVWVTGILGGFYTLHRHSLELSVAREVLDYPEPFLMEGGIPLTADPIGQHEIRLEQVSYRYPGAECDTLQNIDLTLHPGEKLAVVGLNGAGKTTLIKLLCGFLDPTKGRVLFDGKDIRTYNRRDYYTMFSAVFQEFALIAGDVAANVAQNDLSQDMDRVKACIAKAGLSQKIACLPMGYRTHLNREVYDDAAELSGGELQRLMLARALYKNAPIIVLDEPTAALDPIAESDLYQKYAEMTKGRASVYISHRLASTRFCDRIVLIDGGVLAEEGTHEQLMAVGGKYAELFEVQRKYYREEDAGYEEK